jgi:hypothetical protein
MEACRQRLSAKVRAAYPLPRLRPTFMTSVDPRVVSVDPRVVGVDPRGNWG